MKHGLPKTEITRLEIVAWVVGLAILTFELTAARIVSPYLGDTIYTWTSIIGVILAALAYGYYKGGMWADRRKDPGDIVVLLSVAAAFIASLNIVKDGVMAWLVGYPLPLQLQALFASLILFSIPTFVLGVTAPYLARLSISTVASSGRHLSRIDAASTIGSLTGTFLTGYWLFGVVGSSRLLSAIAILLLLTSLLIATKKYLISRVVVLFLIILSIVLSSRPLITGFVNELDTNYGRVVIRDFEYQGREVRALQTDGEVVQSAVFKNGTPGLPFSYTRAFYYATELRPEAERYLVVGGGAFTFPELLARNRTQAHVDVVEIDEQFPQISKDYFGFRQPQNLRIISADGRSYLNQTREEYDMVFIDAFNGIVPPFQLFTKEAMRSTRDSLNDNGILVINVISATDERHNETLRRIMSTVHSEFLAVQAFATDSLPPFTKQNVVIIASSKPITELELAKATRRYPEFDSMIHRTLSIAPERNMVMTDDFAPIEKAAL